MSASLNFDRDFNRAGAAADAGAAKPKKASPKLWVNIGPIVKYTDRDGVTSDRVLALTSGIGLDTAEMLKVRYNDQNAANFQAARNSFTQKLIERGMAMAPGETLILDMGNRFAIEMRRVKEDETVVPAEGDNDFLKGLDFNF